jgi:hypothetical protein
MAEAEAAAEAAMEAAETEAATEAAEKAEIAANEGFGELTPEEQEAKIKENDRIQAESTGQILDSLKLPDGVEPPSSADLGKLQEKSRSLAESVDKPGEILPRLEDSAGSIDEDTGNRLNSSLRPFLESMSSKIDSLIKDSAGKDKFSQFKKLQSKVTEAVENKNPDAYEEASKNLDSFIEDSLKETKTALEEKTEGKGNLKNFSRIASFLKLLGIIGLLGLLTALFMMDNGCWKWLGGAKSQKLNDFDFSKGNNKMYCSCSDTNNFDTPQPLTSWCPIGSGKGDPTYVTCPPYKYPACTIKTDPGGIYYSYYVASPLGVFNSLVNQTTKIIKKGGEGLIKIVKWIVVVICVFISLYFTYEGIVNEEWLYAVGVLVISGVGTAGYFLI